MGVLGQIHLNGHFLNRFANESSKGYFSLNDFYAWAACKGQNSKE